jgi:hypothetical protein
MMTKTTRWISANKYSVIMGSWATSMVGAWAVVNRDKCVRFYILYRGVSSSFDRYMTFSQKIVQVRMWAQGYAFEQMHDTVILKHFEIA